jgi:class 3 adenylate cyclase/YHS domain-containing protein
VADEASWTFAMIDLAGFTALTEAHGDDHAASVALSLADTARASLTERDRLVKTLGDAVFLASPTASDALELATRILQACAARDEYLNTRTGIHSGPAAERDGDFFGAAVNLTARIASQAEGGQVLATAAVAEAARTRGMGVASVGPAAFKNVGAPVELFELDLGAAVELESIDPVCRMRVKHAQAAGRLRHDGVDYWFCSLRCAGRFAAEHAEE